MEIDFLPFQLGMEYENWEFEVESFEDLGRTMRYTYDRTKLPDVFGYELKECFLYFHADILVKIEVEISTMIPSKALAKLNSEISLRYCQNEFKTDNKFKILQKTWSKVNTLVLLQYYFSNDLIKLTISKHRFL